MPEAPLGRANDLQGILDLKNQARCEEENQATRKLLIKNIKKQQHLIIQEHLRVNDYQSQPQGSVRVSAQSTDFRSSFGLKGVTMQRDPISSSSASNRLALQSTPGQKGKEGSPVSGRVKVMNGNSIAKQPLIPTDMTSDSTYPRRVVGGGAAPTDSLEGGLNFSGFALQMKSSNLRSVLRQSREQRTDRIQSQQRSDIQGVLPQQSLGHEVVEKYINCQIQRLENMKTNIESDWKENNDNQNRQIQIGNKFDEEVILLRRARQMTKESYKNRIKTGGSLIQSQIKKGSSWGSQIPEMRPISDINLIAGGYPDESLSIALEERMMARHFKQASKGMKPSGITTSQISRATSQLVSSCTREVTVKHQSALTAQRNLRSKTKQGELEKLSPNKRQKQGLEIHSMNREECEILRREDFKTMIYQLPIVLAESPQSSNTDDQAYYQGCILLHEKKFLEAQSHFRDAAIQTKSRQHRQMFYFNQGFALFSLNPNDRNAMDIWSHRVTSDFPQLKILAEFNLAVLSYYFELSVIERNEKRTFEDLEKICVCMKHLSYSMQKTIQMVHSTVNPGTQDNYLEVPFWFNLDQFVSRCKKLYHKLRDIFQTLPIFKPTVDSMDMDIELETAERERQVKRLWIQKQLSTFGLFFKKYITITSTQAGGMTRRTTDQSQSQNQKFQGSLFKQQNSLRASTRLDLEMQDVSELLDMVEIDVAQAHDSNTMNEKRVAANGRLTNDQQNSSFQYYASKYRHLFNQTPIIRAQEQLEKLNQIKPRYKLTPEEEANDILMPFVITKRVQASKEPKNRQSKKSNRLVIRDSQAFQDPPPLDTSMVKEEEELDNCAEEIVVNEKEKRLSAPVHIDSIIDSGMQTPKLNNEIISHEYRVIQHHSKSPSLIIRNESNNQLKQQQQHQQLSPSTRNLTLTRIDEDQRVHTTLDNIFRIKHLSPSNLRTATIGSITQKEESPMRVKASLAMTGSSSKHGGTVLKGSPSNHVSQQRGMQIKDKTPQTSDFIQIKEENRVNTINNFVSISETISTIRAFSSKLYHPSHTVNSNQNGNKQQIEIMEEFKGPLITKEGKLYDDEGNDEMYKKRLRLREVHKIQNYIQQCQKEGTNTIQEVSEHSFQTIKHFNEQSEMVEYREIDKYLSKLRFFQRFPFNVRKQLIESCKPHQFKVYEAEDTIFKQGEDSPFVNVIIRGSTKGILTKKEYGFIPIVVITFYDGREFGETMHYQVSEKLTQSMVTELNKQKYTCEAMELTFVLAFDKEMTTKIINEGLQDTFEKRLAFLSQIEIFKDIDMHVLLPLAYNLEVQKYRLGEYILREGQAPKGLYIVSKGQIKVGSEQINVRSKDIFPLGRVKEKIKAFKFRGNFHDLESQLKMFQDNGRQNFGEEPLDSKESDDEAEGEGNEGKGFEKKRIFNEFRVFQNDRIYYDEHGKKIKSHIVYKDFMTFFTLTSRDVFGGRVLLLRNDTAKTGQDDPGQATPSRRQINQEDNGTLSVIADSSEVEVLLMDRAHMSYFPEKVQKQIYARIEESFQPECPYEAHIIERVKDKFQEWEQYKLEKVGCILRQQYTERRLGKIMEIDR